MMMQISGVLSHRFDIFSARCLFLTPPQPKSCPFSSTKLELRPPKLRSKGLILRASANSEGDLSPMAPLRLESPAGQLLAQILQTHPHLLVATADQQLDDLQSQRDSSKEMSAQSPQDSLYQRIGEVKEKERRKALEEIIYCLIVQRLVENNISMIPKISPTSDPTGRIDLWPNQEYQFESVHSPEAFEMIISHLALVLSERGMGPLDSIIQMSKIKLGKLYAASIMYGYFLRRVDERYQLERSMGTLPKDFGEDKVVSFEEPKPEKQLWDPDSLIRIYPDEDGMGGGIVDSSYREEEKSPELRSYVMYLDAETLQRYATLRSKEAMSLIEKQTQALFGQPDIRVSEDGSLDTSNDEVVSLAFSGLTMLVLEAVTFGSFLWDTESYAETKYQFINSS